MTPRPEHPWRECEPALLAFIPQDPDVVDIMTRALRAAWDSTADSDREAFHRACCQDSTAPDDLISVERLTEALSAACVAIAGGDPTMPRPRGPQA